MVFLNIEIIAGSIISQGFFYQLEKTQWGITDVSSITTISNKGDRYFM